MKNVFDVILMIWLSLTMIFCIVLFSEEVFIRQQSIHIRNKISEIVEIHGGYTTDAENEVNDLLSNIKYQTDINVSKNGKLEYGEKITFKVILHHQRKIPFFNTVQNVEYSIIG